MSADAQKETPTVTQDTGSLQSRDAYMLQIGDRVASLDGFGTIEDIHNNPANMCTTVKAIGGHSQFQRCQKEIIAKNVARRIKRRRMESPDNPEFSVQDEDLLNALWEEIDDYLVQEKWAFREFKRLHDLVPEESKFNPVWNLDSDGVVEARIRKSNSEDYAERMAELRDAEDKAYDQERFLRSV